MRCTVTGYDGHHLSLAPAEGGEVAPITIIPPTQETYWQEGMLVNLLSDNLIIVEPDYLVDISAIAACFQEWGHHPVSFLLNKMKPRPNSQPILLGNFAGTALDDLIHQEHFCFADTLRDSFRRQALSFCTLTDFNATRFKSDALQQVTNIREAVDSLFSCHDRSRALLEPSFVCEQLGLQGRVDLMTDDLQLLVEQKSGRNRQIELGLIHSPSNLEGVAFRPGAFREDHLVQLLLYYGVLLYNFQISSTDIDMRLLYSRYPAAQGLLSVRFHQQLFSEAISLRNRIVAMEMGIARNGFHTVMPLLHSGRLLERGEKAEFFNRYIRNEADRVMQPLHQLAPHEYDYVERMLTFVWREQLAQKLGMGDNVAGRCAQADLWRVPYTDKVGDGNMFVGLTLAPDHDGTVRADRVTLLLAKEQPSAQATNFRRGDMVYLYSYDDVPDVRHSILYKGVIERLTDDAVTVTLNNPQHLKPHTYAIEHASSDIGTTSAVRSLHAFCTASQERRDLLLGRRTPRRDTARQLSRTYHPHYDAIILQAIQARDYFLLQGPPGTGKTSMALRFLVEEELAQNFSQLTIDNSQLTIHSSLLLTAYTNRAVDEICAMLEENGHDYLRIGNEASCDPRFADHLLDHRLGTLPRMDQMRRMLSDMPIIVATTSSLQSQPFLLQLKHFTLCIADEASQLLEPAIIGLLSSASIDRFILIGDHKQLPAVVAQPDDEPRLHDCRLSLFERLLRQERQAGRTDFTAVLRRQGRMHPDIARFPNEQFYAREQLQPVPLPHQEAARLDYRQPSQDDLDDLLKDRRVLFIDSDPPPLRLEGVRGALTSLIPSPSKIRGGQGALTSPIPSPKTSPVEARIVADLLRRIYRQTADHFDADRTVGVIVPYRNQIAMIRSEVARLGIPALQAISIDTVERFQGSQRDVIIYSFTVRHPSQLDFLTANCFTEADGEDPSCTHVIDRKLNVVMTRARHQLLMTGCASVLRQNALFRKLISEYQY